jgi:L-threonylcarbamoyladenylate synthase
MKDEQMIVKDGQAAHARAAEVVARGGVIAFRTDTFYGLGADPFNRAALRRIKELKGREEGKPILVVISDEWEVERFIAEQTPVFRELRARHWPGALTLVARARSVVPEELTAGTGTVGVRLPDDDEARALVRACGGALTATSANLAGGPPARTAAEVAAYFPALDLIIDGGPARCDQPSTVVEASGAAPRLIREGAIPRSALELAGN